MPGWSWFTSYSVKIREGYWITTMPMCCPDCGLPWNDDGISRPYRGHVRRHWGPPPASSGETICTVYYQCEGCGHCACERKKPPPVSGGAQTGGGLSLGG